MTLLQLLKALGLVGATLLAGSQAFLHLMWRPVLRTTAPAFVREADAALRRRVLWLATAGFLALALAARSAADRIGVHGWSGALP